MYDITWDRRDEYSSCQMEKRIEDEWKFLMQDNCIDELQIIYVSVLWDLSDWNCADGMVISPPRHSENAQCRGQRLFLIMKWWFYFKKEKIHQCYLTVIALPHYWGWVLLFRSLSWEMSHMSSKVGQHPESEITAFPKEYRTSRWDEDWDHFFVCECCLAP